MMNKAQKMPGTDASRVGEAAIDVMSSLTRVMIEEVEFLKKRDYAAMEASRQEKVKLIRVYELNMKALNENPSLLKTISEDMKGKIKQVAAAFKIATEKNAEEVKAALTATQALLQTVMNAARKENKKTDAYSDPRKTPLMLGSYSPVCDPIAVSRIV